MSSPASDFFGIEFNNKKPDVVQASPEPTQRGVVTTALEFFGIDFQAKPKPPKKVVPVPVQTTAIGGDWRSINASYKAGHESREQTRLDTLKSELSREKDSKNIESLKREISRVEKGMKNG